MIGNKKNLTHKFKVHYEVTDCGRTVTATVTPTVSPLTSKSSFCGVATYKGSGGFCIDTGKAIARKKAVRRYFKWLKNITRKTRECLKMDIADLYECERHCQYMINQIDSEIEFMVEE